MNNNANLPTIKDDLRNKFMLPNVFSEIDYRKNLNEQNKQNQNDYMNIVSGKNEFKEKESSYNYANQFSNRVLNFN